jgi:hypothetical protein
MLDTDIRKPTGPNSGEGEKSFFLTSHPFFQISLLDWRIALGLRLSLFTMKWHSGPLMLLDSSLSQALNHAGPTASSRSAPFRLDEYYIALSLNRNEPRQPFQ